MKLAGKGGFAFLAFWSRARGSGIAFFTRAFLRQTNDLNPWSRTMAVTASTSATPISPGSGLRDARRFGAAFWGKLAGAFGAIFAGVFRGEAFRAFFVGAFCGESFRAFLVGAFRGEAFGAFFWGEFAPISAASFALAATIFAAISTI